MVIFRYIFINSNCRYQRCFFGAVQRQPQRQFRISSRSVLRRVKTQDSINALLLKVNGENATTTISGIQATTGINGLPPLTIPTDTNSASLAKAVVASSMRGASTPKPMTRKPSIVDPTNIDSRYLLQTHTPDSSGSEFADNGSVVGGNRLLLFPTRKPKKLKPFNKPIPQLTQTRFEDLREPHANNLNKLTREFPRCQGMLMSLKVLGESEDKAEPWVFVQCDKAIAKKVRSFFKQPAVRSDFQPSRPDSFSPHFEIFVYELPPRL
jgi:hypothetical protein